MERYKLLPNDALIAATCRHYGIKRIATFDEEDMSTLHKTTNT